MVSDKLLETSTTHSLLGYHSSVYLVSYFQYQTLISHSMLTRHSIKIKFHSVQTQLGSSESQILLKLLRRLKASNIFITNSSSSSMVQSELYSHLRLSSRLWKNALQSVNSSMLRLNHSFRTGEQRTYAQRKLWISKTLKTLKLFR